MSKKIIVLLLASLLVLSACAGVKYGRTKEQAAFVDDAHVGTRGVEIDFVKNNPPNIVYTGSPMDIVVELRNQGATRVEGASLHLSGYDSRLFNIQPKKQENIGLEPKTKFNTFGGYDTAAFSSNNIYLPSGTESLDQNFLASICYNYRTEARIPVCIDPNPLSVLENEACRVINPVVGGGQGAPVAVTSVREDAAPGKVSFLITVANLGDGNVVNRASLNRCPGELKFNDVDTLTYSVILSGQAGDCKPAGDVKLANKQGNIHCTFNLIDAVSPAYTTVLEVNLDYAYLSQEARQIKIRSIN